MDLQYTRALYHAACIGLLALLAAGPAQAVDGVIEINQARVKAGGVTPGDTPLFPATIDQPGSYRLTGNLDVTDATARPGGTLAENTTGILVTVDDVTIDLNGFSIKGSTVCSPTPHMCSPTGSGKGIDADNHSGIGVMNGNIRGMGNHGIELGSRSHLENIIAISNGGAGMLGGTVANCTADLNGSTGIGATTVTNSVSFRNFRGIASGIVTGCTAGGNDDEGISGTAVTGSSATFNGATGIRATTAANCTAFGNSADIIATGIVGHNICGSPGVPCPP